MFLIGGHLVEGVDLVDSVEPHLLERRVFCWVEGGCSDVG